MEQKIGQAAGRIWQVLSTTDGPVNITDLAKFTGLKTQIAYQGLGWLAREGKIAYHTNGAKTSLSLTSAECIC